MKQQVQRYFCIGISSMLVGGLLASCGQKRETAVRKQSNGISPYMLTAIKGYYQKEYGRGTTLKETNSDSVLEITYNHIPTATNSYDGLLIAITIPKTIEQECLTRGDMNGDGKEDIVVSIRTNGGGFGDSTGWRDHILFLADGNKQYHLASVSSDGALCPGYFNAEKIENGYLIGKSITYTDGDACCCPSFKYTTKLRYQNGKLQVVYNDLIK